MPIEEVLRRMQEQQGEFSDEEEFGEDDDSDDEDDDDDDDDDDEGEEGDFDDGDDDEEEEDDAVRRRPVAPRQSERETPLSCTLTLPLRVHSRRPRKRRKKIERADGPACTPIWTTEWEPPDRAGAAACRQCAEI